MFTIRTLQTPEELFPLEQLQRDVWPGSETDIAPLHVFIAAVHNGGLALGAFEEEKIVGFLFGFPGIEFAPGGARPKHCSHMMGVRPDCRDDGIGFALKRAQRQAVQRQGLDLITWTYDPLLSRNAYLNIAKLGAVCSTYRRAEYGEMRDGLNAGLPSDRFQVDWRINTPRVQRRLETDARPIPTLERAAEMGLRPGYAVATTGELSRPPEKIPPLEGSPLLAEIPADLLRLKAADAELARAWRSFTRELFESAFEKNYLVVDFIFAKNPARGFYLLAPTESDLASFE